MSFPDKCPNCGADPRAYQERSDVRAYSCGAWIIENSYSKGPHTQKTETCDNRKTIRAAAAIIREMVDEWGNAMDEALLVKAEEWLKDNEP
jgi:hypothetical protein